MNGSEDGAERVEESRGAQVAALTSVLLIAQQVAGKAARDTLFLSSFHSSRLPLAMAGGALLSLASAFWLSRMMVRRAPATIMPVLFGASACGFALEWVLAGWAPRASALLVYLQTAMLGPAMITTFWSLINERFDPHTAKRAVSRISGGGALGGVLAGLATWRASSFIQPITVLLFLALVNAAAIVSTVVTRARRRATAPLVVNGADEAAPLATLRREPFLRNLGVLIALGAAISALLDYLLSAQATQSFAKGQPLLSFFSLFWLAVGVASFALQLALGRVALEKLGLAINVAILPAIIVLGGAFGLAVPGLASAALLRGAEAVQRNTLFRSAYELFYTPVPEASKRATKALIDVGCDRVGTVCGSGLTLLAVHGLLSAHPQALLVAVVVLALLTLPVTRQLHLGYVEALQQGLRDGAAQLKSAAKAELAPLNRPSPATQREREELIERVEGLQPGGLSALLDADSASPEPPSAAAPASTDGEASLQKAHALLSPDGDRVKRALRELKPHEPAVACAISLLAHPEWHDHALQALSAHAPRVTGQLLDALLDPDTDFVIRRRLPRALRACATQRAADGLLLGVAEERFEVRYACARALLDVTDANPSIVISKPLVVAAIGREVESRRQLEQRSSEHSQVDLELEPERDEQRALVGDLVRDRAYRSLEHLFTILSLVLEREPLRLAFKALHHHDGKYRGTALEYLDTVLPRDIHEMVWPHIGDGAPLPAARPTSELLADLARAAEAGEGAST